jgi:hypothetical protein
MTRLGVVHVRKRVLSRRQTARRSSDRGFATSIRLAMSGGPWNHAYPDQVLGEALFTTRISPQRA